MDMQEQQEGSPLTLFYSYADKDEKLCAELEKHLSILQRQRIIAGWDRRKLLPGVDKNQVSDEQFSSAQIILLLVSPDFLASDASYAEMERALQRHKAGLAIVIPLLLRPVDWKPASFAHLQALPHNGVPVTKWGNRDEAFADITKDIRLAIEQRNGPSFQASHSAPSTGDRPALNQLPASHKPGYLKGIYSVALKFVSQALPILSSIVLLILGFKDLPTNVPFLSIFADRQVGTPIIGGVLLLLTLIAIVMFFSSSASQPANTAPAIFTIKARTRLWQIAIILSTTCMLISTTLLVLVLARPTWCPQHLCRAVITDLHATYDDNLSLSLSGIHHASLWIPDDPTRYNGTTPPNTSNALRIDQQSSADQFQLSLSIRNLQQSRYQLLIEHVSILIKDRIQVPYPLNVWTPGQTGSYTKNPYQLVYNNEPRGTVISATYTPVPYANVYLEAGETDNLMLQIISKVTARIHFQLQIAYRYGNETHSHTLMLPDEFDLIFSNAENWHYYRIQNGLFVPNTSS
jgi:TIR domain